MSYLILYPGKPSQSVIELTTHHLRIGRDSSCQLCLHEEGVSTQHAQLEQCGQGYAIRDLDSTNGTEINGRPITFQLLNDNDRITIGEVELVFSRTGVLGPTPAATPVGPVEPEVMVPEHYPAPASGGATAPTAPQPAAPQPMEASGVAPALGGMLLPLLAFLASLTIIGFPLALVMGIMAYVHLRNHGGAPLEWKLTRWALGISLVSFLVLALAATAVVMHKNAQLRKAEAKEQIIENEATSIRLLKGISAAQAYAHTIEWVDRDGDGEGEFLSLDELIDAGATFVPGHLATGRSSGYRFTVDPRGESSFEAYAEPLDHGTTGLRTFLIDQTGTVRGGDLDGKPFREDPRALPVLPAEQNALQGLADEMARDIEHYLKTLPQNGTTVQKVQRIVKRLKTDFAFTESGQAFAGITASADRFISEQRGMDLWLTANQQAADGQVEAALSSLRQLLETVPDYSRRPEVEARLKALQRQWIQEQEQDAAALKKEADTLEQGGDQQGALQLYSDIERLYPNTESARRIKGTKPKLDRQLREQQAEALFFTLVELNPVQDYTRVLSLADQLSRDHNDTAAYSSNRKSIEAHVQKAQTQKWRVITLEDMEQGRTRAALARLEAAAETHPDLRLELRDVFVELYEKIGARFMEEQDYREALRIYAALSELVQGTHEAHKIPADTLAELHYKVGFAEADQKQYESARFHLSQAALKYQDDAFFQLKLGIASLHSGRYTPAAKALSRALQLNKGLEQASLYRAYLNLRYTIFSERALVSTFNPNPASGTSTNAAAGVSEFDEMLKQLQDSMVHAVTAPEYEGLLSSPVPDPGDVDINLEYNHAASSLLLPATIALIRKFNDARSQFSREMMQAQVDKETNVEEARMKSSVVIANYQAQLSAIRKAVNQDARHSAQFLALVNTMQRQLTLVIQDLKAVATANPDQRALATRIASEADRKRRALKEAHARLSKDLGQRSTLQAKAMGYAEQVLKELRQNTNSGLNVVTLLRELNRSAAEEGSLEKGRQALQNAIQSGLHLEDIYDAASGRMRVQSREE